MAERIGDPWSFQDIIYGSTLNLVLLGKIGAGKSASGNTILGREAFQSKKSFSSVTQDVAVESGIVCGRRVTVYDTPGLFNTKLSEQEIQQIYANVLQRCESGLCVFLLVIKADRFTGKERQTVEKIEKLLGEVRLKKTWILFTRGDQLEEENKSIDEFINETKPLKRLVQKYDQRYHVFNNKTKGQVQELLTKIYSTYPDTIEQEAKPKQKVYSPLRGVSGMPERRWGVAMMMPQMTKSAVMSGFSTHAAFRPPTAVSGFSTHAAPRRPTAVSGFSTHAAPRLSTAMSEMTLCEESAVMSGFSTHAAPRLPTAVSGFSTYAAPRLPTAMSEMTLCEEQEAKLEWPVYSPLLSPVSVRSVMMDEMVLLDSSDEDSLDTCVTPGWFSVRYKARDTSRRIVLLGQTGAGKSAAGNTILGQKQFISIRSTKSVTSECSVIYATVSGRSVSVIDTPGLYHTEMKPDQLVTEIQRSVYLSSPGPHAFLIVINVYMRFTEHEQQIPQMIEMMFDEEVLKYSIILFTHGDLLEGESVEELIEENCRLRDVVGQCGGRFHVFNNRDVNNRDQVNDLLQKIDTMIEQNGGGHYSHQMYEDAQRFRREEEEKRQREEKQRREEIERVRKETEEKIRAEFEGPPRFLQERLKSIRLRKEDRKRQVEELEELKRGFSQLHSSRTIMRMPMGMRRRRGEEKKQREKQQLQEEIERVIKETEEKIRAEFEGPPRFLLERVKLRLRDEQERKSQEEKQRQEETERVRKETEEEIVTELLEGFKSMRLREEEERKQREEEQRREETERVRKETEEKIRAEFEGPPRFLQERLKAMNLRVEDSIRQVEEDLFGGPFYHPHEMEEHIDFFMEICRAEYKGVEIESLIKETEEEIRAEFNKL